MTWPDGSTGFLCFSVGKALDSSFHQLWETTLRAAKHSTAWERRKRTNTTKLLVSCKGSVRSGVLSTQRGRTVYLLSSKWGYTKYGASKDFTILQQSSLIPVSCLSEEPIQFCHTTSKENHHIVVRVHISASCRNMKLLLSSSKPLPVFVCPSFCPAQTQPVL